MSETTKLALLAVALTHENDEFRNVIWTGEKTQLMPMAIPEGGEIGGEPHEGHDQLVHFVAGTVVAKTGTLRTRSPTATCTKHATKADAED